ncbi:unnamed protein product [Arabidopsis halleri]
MEEDNNVTRFCKVTSACKDAAFYYLEGFDWNLEDAISGFLGDQLPPLKMRATPRRVNEWRYRSRSPLRRRYSATSVSEPKFKMHQDEITITRSSDTAALATSLDDSRRELHDSDDISHGEKIVSIANPVNQEFKEEGSSVQATKICESTSIEIDLPSPDPDSDSD